MQIVKNGRTMQNISQAYAGCPGSSPAISIQFTLEMCAAAEKCKTQKI